MSRQRKMQMTGSGKGVASSEATRIARKLGTVSGGRVLDVATGEGGFIDILMKTLKGYDSFVGIDYYPSDPSKGSIEDARRVYVGKPVRFLKMNAEHIGFDDGSFDTVCISNSLHHLDNVDRVLSEMKRVVRPGGNFILQEAYCDGDQTEAQKAEELEHEWGARIDNLLGITHNKTFARQRIIDIVDSLQLREKEVFDSSHSVDCLFCPKRRECGDPKRQAELHDSLGDVDAELERIAHHPDLDSRRRLTEEGRRVKAAIAKHGIASSSYIFVVGRK
ncbi:MAG: class I SAM-dependent methyltransferase [Candidatus Thermoplasmatota archaeon]